MACGRGRGALDSQSKTEIGDVGWREDGKEQGGEDLFRIQGSRCAPGSPYLPGRRCSVLRKECERIAIF